MVRDNFPNISILAKSPTPGEVQLTFMHVYFRNKFLGGSIAALSLAGLIDSPSVVSVDFNITCAMDDDKM